MIEVLTDNHYEKLMNLFGKSDNSIKIISPFISKSIAEKLCDIVRNKKIKCTFITRIYLEDMLNKANSIDAIKTMLDEGIEIYALKRLHTKLYLFDLTEGVLGSANFTAGGFSSNIELSLLFSKEENIIKELHEYYDNLLCDIKKSNESRITYDIISMLKEKYKKGIRSKMTEGTVQSTFMFGAELKNNPREYSDNIINELKICESESDIVNDIFKRKDENEQIIFEHNIWLKFHGEGSNRLYGRYEPPVVNLKNKKVFVSNYSRTVTVKNGDEIYIAALTIGKNQKSQPYIIGRGILKEFNKDNYVSSGWIKNHEWMEKYPWYCIITKCEILDSEVWNGLALDEVWAELGSNTYISSFGKNETISDVSKKHWQKAHIRITGNAKQYIDNKLDELFDLYGEICYESDKNDLDD